MKVLFLCLFPVEANNSAMMRNLALVQGLKLNGYKVDFVTIPKSRYQVVIGNNNLQEINIIRLQGNNVYDAITSSGNEKIAVIKELGIKFLRKIYHKLNVFNYTYKIAKNIDINVLTDVNYDLVISSSDPKTSHIAMNNLRKQGLRFKKWVQYWGDPLALDITNNSIHPQFYLRYIERKVLEPADKIIYVSPFTLQAQASLYPDLAKKMHFKPIPYTAPKIYPRTNNSKFLITYFGAYKSVSRNIKPLFDACVNLQDKVDLVVMGDSDIELPKKENVAIFPRGDISNYETNSDLLVCVMNKTGTQIPGKIYHYAATNKPILVILDGENRGEMRRYLESYNRYFICNNSKDDIVNTINSIIDRNDLEFEPCKSFAPEIIVKEILQVCQNDE